MISLVNKTVYPNTGQLTTGTFSLSGTSTIGNWLIAVVMINKAAIAFGVQIALATNAGESLTHLQSSSNGNSYEGIHILHTTLAATSITFSQLFSGRIPAIIVYEISGTGITTAQTVGSQETNVPVSSFTCASTSGTISQSTFFVNSSGTNDVGAGGSGVITACTTAGWVADIINTSGVRNIEAAGAYLISTGTQQATFTVSPSDYCTGVSAAFSETGGGGGGGGITHSCTPLIPQVNTGKAYSIVFIPGGQIAVSPVLFTTPAAVHINSPSFTWNLQASPQGTTQQTQIGADATAPSAYQGFASDGSYWSLQITDTGSLYQVYTPPPSSRDTSVPGILDVTMSSFPFADGVICNTCGGAGVQVMADFRCWCCVCNQFVSDEDTSIITVLSE